MRTIARQIIQAALNAVDPYTAVTTHLKRDNNRLICDSQPYNLNEFERVLVVGFGKGSAPMAHAAHSLLADRITAGLVIVKYNHTLPPAVDISPVKLVEAGHPVPDSGGVANTRALINLLDHTTDRDLILCLISGGGSALFVQPAPGLSLAQVQDVTQHLLNAGAPIADVNTVRKHLSVVKGGQLARLARPATLLSLIVSDVAGDRLDTIASGPTAPDPSTFTAALDILDTHRLTRRLPPAVVAHLRAGAQGRAPETPKPGDPAFERVQNVIIANNRMALNAAAQKARRLGFTPTVTPTFVEGEARRVGQEVALMAQKLCQPANARPKPAAIIWGGETTVTVRGTGRGGRNQELALAAALQLADCPDVLVACVATDGNDGPTDAAGAFADGTTVRRAVAANLSPQACLNNNDSYHFFRATGDLIVTGPTNTNVN
ncbi:MAG: glycerate kinase, partial [Anaerolineae bacterium]